MKKILLVGLVVLFCSALAKAELTVNKVKGVAESYLADNNQWQKIEEGMSFKEGDKIKTGADGRLELAFTSGSKVWIRENTNLAISALETAQELGGYATEFNIERGKIRSKVVKIGKGNKFTMRTPTSVASIRGTDLAVEVTETGETQLFVFEGSVDFNNNTSGEIVSVGAGETSSSASSGEMAAPREMSQEEKQMAKENWMEAKLPTAEQRQETQSAREEKKQEQKAEKTETRTVTTTSLRQELQNFVSETKMDITTLGQITTENRQSDFETGRSIRDYHGNLVSVSQEIKRPDLKTMEIVNITKRDNYIYKGKWNYGGDSKGKIDVMNLTFKFNKDLPRDVKEWPSFFAAESKDFHPESMKFLLTNTQDTLSTETTWDSVKEQLSEGKIYLNNQEIITDDSILTEAQKNVKVPEGESGIVDIKDSQGNVTETIGEIWGKGEIPIWLKDKDYPNDRSKDKLVWLQTENYMININDGKVVDVNYFKSNKDTLKNSDKPFTVLKGIVENIGMETIWTAKIGDRLNLSYRGKDYFTGGNLDLIMTTQWIITEVDKLPESMINLGLQTAFADMDKK